MNELKNTKNKQDIRTLSPTLGNTWRHNTLGKSQNQDQLNSVSQDPTDQHWIANYRKPCKIARATGRKVDVLNSKLEFIRCLIPTLVTEDRTLKPYQTNTIRYERDIEEEEEDIWDEEENPNERNRTQDVRRTKPSKRRKANAPEEKRI